MRILISYDNMLPHTTGNYFAEAFKQMPDILIDWSHPSKLGQVNKSYYDLFIKIDDGLFCNEWREDLHPSIYYIIDSHIEPETNWRREMVKKGNFDYLFTAQKNGAEQLGINSEWIPLGCDPRVHTFQWPLPEDKPHKIYDVCFIGNFHSGYREKRIDYAEALFREFPNFFHGNRFFNEMAMKFAESKIVFNQSLNNDVNMRIYEACCSGSFQLTSEIKNNGLEELYTPGEHLVVYDSMGDMLEKAKYYLDNDVERERIALAGFNHTIQNHTYNHRINVMMEKVGLCITA
jgi:spore maturation protein CgeB